MGKFESITVGLPAEQVALLRQAVGSGQYDSEDDVIAEALLEWQMRHIAAADPIAMHLGALWDEGKASGKVAPYDLSEVLAEVDRRDVHRG